MDRAEMSTKILGGKHRGQYHWATVYGVQPGQRYWVQWGAFIKDRPAFPKSDYRVWISDKHKVRAHIPVLVFMSWKQSKDNRFIHSNTLPRHGLVR